MAEPPEADGMVQLGAYEAADAKRVLEALEAAGVAFEIEMDESPLKNPLRDVQVLLLMNPPGSQIVVYVPAAEWARASEAVARA